VVSPQFIGGMRLVSEMVRPTVVSFLDLMLRDRDKGMRVEEVRVQAGSALAGLPLTDRAVADTDVLILAIQAPGEKTFAYGPSSGSVLTAGCTMIVLGSAASVNAVREKAGVGI
jgi:voltage-gated potassium channel